MKQGKLFIGTSGWNYSGWREIFYPENLKSQDFLRFYSSQFKTVEVNYSFYHLPKPTTCIKWYNQTPKDFVFSVKASRFITHIKRLKGVKISWRKFLENALNLKEKLGPILFQFPPNFKATEENIKRLKNFLSISRGRTSPKLSSILGGSTSKNLKWAFEFRHPSWCEEKIYKLLRKNKVGWVIADSSRYPKAEAVTADFIYIRMHGPKELFASKYPRKEIKNLASKIKKWLKQDLDVYVYFNNDAMGYAVENAKALIALVG